MSGDYFSPLLQFLLPLPVPGSEISLAAIGNLRFATGCPVPGEHGSHS